MFSKGFMSRIIKGDRKSPEVLHLIWRLLLQLWILSIIVIFFFVRILGSKAAARLLTGISKRFSL